MNRIGDNLVCTGSNQELVEALNRSGVEFLVVGGLGVSWHCSTRQADDMDLLVNPTPENAEHIFAALSALRLNGFNNKSFTKPGVQAPLKGRHYADLLTPRKGGPTFSELAADAVGGNLFNMPARIASVAALIRLKELAIATLEAEKDKHVKDIQLLTAVSRKIS